MCSDPKSRIRTVLDEQGHTYRSVGEIIGITPQAVCEIVNGRTRGASARYALASVLGMEVEDFWPDRVGGDHRSPERGAGERTGEVAGGSDPRPPARERKGRRRSRRVVSVSVCCPKNRVPSSVDLGVAEGEGPGELTVLRCEHFRGRSLDCDMECLSARRAA